MSQRFAPYKAALEAISSRTRTPLSSLFISFAIFHELTAIAPLVSVFFLAHSFGIGKHAVDFLQKEISHEEQDKDAWLREKGRKWLNEDEEWAGRVGRRYGIFGFPKKSQDSEPENETSGRPSNGIAGDVANAVFAYGVTKALLPAHVGLSLYLVPAFSRSFVDPVRRIVSGQWAKRKTPQVMYWPL